MRRDIGGYNPHNGPFTPFSSAPVQGLDISYHYPKDLAHASAEELTKGATAFRMELLQAVLEGVQRTVLLLEGGEGQGRHLGQRREKGRRHSSSLWTGLEPMTPLNPPPPFSPSLPWKEFVAEWGKIRGSNLDSVVCVIFSVTFPSLSSLSKSEV